MSVKSQETFVDKMIVGASALLSSMLPEDWKVERQDLPVSEQLQRGWQRGLRHLPDLARLDGQLVLREPNGGSVALYVDAKAQIAPRAVRELVSRVELARQINPTATLLLVSPWLSPRTREMLRDYDVNHLDLTGNVWLQVRYPALVVRTTGAEQDPEPKSREGVSLRGDRAWRVLRAVVDLAPPCTVSELANEAGVSMGYVSRIVDALDREALITRGARGSVREADWVSILRRQAEGRSLFQRPTGGFIAPMSPSQTMLDLAVGVAPYGAVTGSFPAAKLAPVAAPAQLVVYVENAEYVADVLGLLPTATGADVVLIEPSDPAGVLARPLDGLLPARAVGFSQLVVDCLSGNGRMPAEGEAVLEHMQRDPGSWQKRAPR